MKGPNRTVLLAGLGATLLVLLFGIPGLLDRIEFRTQDVRFLYARRTARPLGDEVRLVAIDDSALDTIARWPWSRDVFAVALDEIARAGAKTVAIDVLFTDAQAEAPDRALAAEAHDVADRAGLDAERRARFLERSSQFRKIAAWRELVRDRAAGRPPESELAFRLALTKGDTSLERFPERILVEEAYDRDRSFGTLARFMAPGTGEGSALDAPPIPVLAERAAGIGFANSKADKDGEYRRVRPLWPTPYGSLPQFGLAAGLRYLGLPPSEVRVEDGRLRLPDGWEMPLDAGAIRVHWPTAVFESDGEDRRTGETGVVAIGALVDLGRQRQVLAEQERRYVDLGADIAQLQGLPADGMRQVPVDAKLRAAVREQGEFIAGSLDVHGTDDLKDASDEERRTVGLYREWWRLDREVASSRARVDAASAEARRQLGGRLVFVGWVATGAMADMVNTVFGPRTPGVYFHAAVADMVIGRHALVVWPAWTGWIAAAGLGALAAWLAWRTGAGVSTTAVLGGAAAWVGFSAWAFAVHDVMVPVAVPVLAALASQAASVSTAAVVNQREKARITRQFRARVSPQLVDLLSSDPNAVSMRGEQRKATILFGDLAGFTTISEKLGSEAVVATLNLYMGAMATELTNRRAYVNKFLGDGLLAFWSAFGEEPEQGQLAVEACRACQRVVTEIGTRPERQGLPKVSLRLGVATGVVTIGDCGAPPDLNDYTVIGDSANLAARLESANKQFGTAILFDGNTRELVRDAGGLPIVPLGQVVVVGQSVPIDLFTMLVEEPPAGWIESVGRAVDSFARGDMAACGAAWDAHEAAFGTTKIAVPFREAIADPADRRDGVLRLRAK